MTRRAVFLDRDGVLNQAVERAGKPYPPPSVAELVFLPGVASACSALRTEGAFLGCVTNQPDIARGLARREEVEAINAVVSSQLGLDDLIMCPHDNDANCLCRKPKPGMLIALADRHGLALCRSVMIGDRRSDIEAGQRAGCATIFIDHRWNEPRPEGMDAVFESLSAAVPWIRNFLMWGKP